MESEISKDTLSERDQVFVIDNVDAIGSLFNSKSSSEAKAKQIKPPSPPFIPRQPSTEKPESFATFSKYYDTNNANRGVVLIFNHYQFSNSHLNSSNGTNKDRDYVAYVFKKMNFDVRIHNDLKYAKLMEVLAAVSEEDHRNNDCIVIVMMTHGDDGLLYASDSSYPVSELWNSFVGNNCPSLIGKPKLVFIQACRGDKLDSGSKYDKNAIGGGDRADSAVVPNKVTYYIPQMADLLVMFSTFEGHYSWRNPDFGSWFIQSLCDEFLENWQTLDLLTILTGVARRVAYEYQSNVPGKYHMDCMKQMPCVTSMLTKTLYFTKKN